MPASAGMTYFLVMSFLYSLLTINCYLHYHPGLRYASSRLPTGNVIYLFITKETLINFVRPEPVEGHDG